MITQLYKIGYGAKYGDFTYLGPSLGHAGPKFWVNYGDKCLKPLYMD